MTDNSTDNNLGVTGPLTFTCGIPEDLLEPIFPYTFQSSRAIDSAHRIPPRFGKSSDLVLAITGTEKEQNSYLRGVLASDIALFSLFIVWIGVLIHFYRQGPQKRGWLSGRRIPLPPKPTFSANDDEQAVAPKRNNDSAVVLGRDDCTFRHKEDSVDSHMYTIQQEETSEAESEEKKDEENEGKPSEEQPSLPRTKEGKVEQQLEEVFQPIITEDGWIGRGWLSGRRMPLPPKPTCSANDDEQAVAPRQNVGSAVVLEGDDCTFRHKEDFVDSHTCTIQQEETSDAESEEKKDEENEGKPSEEKHPLPRTEEGKVEQQLEEDFQPMITEDEWNQLYHQRQKQNRIFKSLVAFAALSIIIAAILVQVYGVPALSETVDSGLESVRQLKDIIVEIMSLLERTMDDLTIIYNGFLDLALFITSLCPAVEVCEKLTNSSTCNATGIQMQEFLTDHFTSKQAVFWYIQSFYNDTLGIQRVANQIDDTLDNLEWFRSVSFFFQTLLALLCVWILLGLIVKMPFQRAQKRAFFLTFCIFVIISFAFCMAFIFGAITAADLCVDSPDDKLVAVLEHNLNRVSPIVAGLGRYYISHCEDTPHEIADLINDLAENSRQMQSMAVQLPRWGFEDECIKPLVDKSMWLFDKLCKTAGLLKEIRVLAQCSKWYPLYEVFVYQTVCGSVDGSSWFAASQLVVVFMAMVILTFRVASFDYE